MCFFYFGFAVLSFMSANVIFKNLYFSLFFWTPSEASLCQLCSLKQVLEYLLVVRWGNSHLSLTCVRHPKRKRWFSEWHIGVKLQDWLNKRAPCDWVSGCYAACEQTASLKSTPIDGAQQWKYLLLLLLCYREIFSFFFLPPTTPFSMLSLFAVITRPAQKTDPNLRWTILIGVTMSKVFH